MKYTEIQGDLFKNLVRDKDNKLTYTEDDVPVYCHCIANDGRWGAGIAPIFIDKVFDFRKETLYMLNHHKWDGTGWCGLTCKVISGKPVFMGNLVTKRSTSGKPSYVTITESLKSLRKSMEESYLLDKDFVVLKMPKIGCGLDKLDWSIVSTLIKGVFSDTNISIEIYYL
jgi:hypothetical protein